MLSPLLLKCYRKLTREHANCRDPSIFHRVSAGFAEGVAEEIRSCMNQHSDVGSPACVWDFFDALHRATQSPFKWSQ